MNLCIAMNLYYRCLDKTYSDRFDFQGLIEGKKLELVIFVRCASK